MPLKAGGRLSHYELTRPLGEGGMGVVWEAKDTVLDRAVAVKILPEDFAGSPDRLSRFQREARLLAALNHPHIGAIHGLEEDRGIRFLVLELVPGETLEEVLSRGPVPVPEALEIARQAADALEAAHEAGIIHRDLKPANVKVTPEGKVKVLDFGLAKALGTGGEDPFSTEGDPGLSHSPTLTSGGTRTGVILGTAAYMSPEQARGKVVDRRADIWSFGCLLYEMLAGQRPFGGETVTDALAAVLEREPDWSRLAGRTPARIRELLRRCLEKDPRHRLRDMGDARLELEEALGTRAWSSPGMAPAAASDPPGDGAAPAGRSRAWARAGAAFILGAAAGVLLWVAAGPDGSAGSPPAGVLRLSVPLPDNFVLQSYRLSPDGAALVVQAQDLAEDKREDHLYLRRLDGPDLARLDGTRGVDSWDVSPDGQWIAFLARENPQSTSERLQKIRLDGGPPVPLWEAPAGSLHNLRWCTGDSLLAAMRDGARRSLVRLGAGGGPPEVVSPADRFQAGGVDSLDPLPGCRGALLTRFVVGERGFHYAVDAVPLDGGEHVALFDEGRLARFVPTGHVVFSRGHALFAALFDPVALRLTGPVFPVASGLHVGPFWESAAFDVTPGGILAYRPGGQVAGRRTLAVVDREGRVEPLTPLERPYEGDLTVAPGGTRLAVVIPDASALYQIWIHDMGRGILRPLPVAGSDCTDPVFSPDARRIAYRVDVSGEPSRIDVREVDGGGAPQTLLAMGPEEEGTLYPSDWSPDGTLLAVTEITPGGGRILLVPAAGGGDPRILETGGRVEGSLRFSPDGKWLALVSDRSGRREAYLRRLDGGDGEWVVSDGGAESVFWNRAGDELFFQDHHDRLRAVAVRLEPEVSLGRPRIVADAGMLGAARRGEVGSLFALAPDGERIAFVRKGDDERVARRIDLVLGWFAELREKAPAGPR